MKTNLSKWVAITLVGLGATAACKKDKSSNDGLLLGLLALNQQGSAGLQVNSARSLVNESNDNYAQNNWGLIEHSTLQRWTSNWRTNKPSHIPEDGKLIVLQLNAASSNHGFVPHNASQNVFTYNLDRSFVFNQTRDSGLVSETVAVQADGAKADEFLKLYNINLSKDLVVFVNGDGGAGDVQTLTRGIYWLRYWGADIRHLALLNGNLTNGNRETNATAWGTFAPTASTPPNNGTFSVKQLRNDNTILTLGLEDILAIVDDNYQTSRVSGITNRQVIIDARPAAQFNQTAQGHNFASGNNDTTDTQGQYITTSWASAGAPGGNTAKTYVLFEGHIKGAKTFFWQDLFEGESAGAAGNGFRYKSKTALRQLFIDRLEYQEGQTIVSQCRTNYEVQVNGFAALNILGYPTVYYDGSLVEWTSLVSDHPDGGTSGDIINLQPTDPAYRFRTDTTERSNSPRKLINGTWRVAYNRAESNPVRVRQARINRNATTTKLFQAQDRAYKLQ